MKARVMKAVFPLAAVVFAVAGAFAFSSAPQAKGAATFIGVARVGESECEESAVLCQDIDNNDPCFDGAVPLYKMVGETSCPNQLWRIH
ncbi:DUF6520 family protein [uncultured Flavobacterium sp.]|uniref:DUF6520 family protein n=1 Tax=uncultured Flavobacterium sp. TaxID=165435 RepID=UPI0025F5315C|nr:DUF6520 family protein [uncultured Flavobacterium sp.]